ncbi:MAG: tyrosine-type recombinase/integrase [Solirubrobacterales bacterium]|nr:tyrosine-type recombinase/integrase [Solirubrobacterales bacterium]
MSVDLRAAASDYLRDRRARGYVLADEDWLLGRFLDDLDERGQTTITVAAALTFATQRAGATAGWQARKLRAVRGLAAHVYALDPNAAQLIPAGLIASKTPRRIPYLYSQEQIVALMDAARALSPRMLGESMRTLIGLLAATGMRSGEAAALDVEDFDPDRRLLRVSGKNRRLRELPLHPTTVQALLDYLQIRAQLAPRTGPLLIGAKGGRLNLNSARAAFRALVNDCRLPVAPGCRAPRLHDARHSFAVNTLIDAHRQGVDVDAQIATLANYLGHVDPAHTYWYLTASPQLMQTVRERMTAWQEAVQ